MPLAIATNNAALQAAAFSTRVNRAVEISMARLSTGSRINAASDDAAGLGIASRLNAEILGTNQAIRNALDGQALIDTAEGAHREIEHIVQRMREIAVQAANDTNSLQDRSNMQTEMEALETEIDRIASTTSWAGQSLISTGGTSFKFQVGNATGVTNQINAAISAATAAELGLYTSDSSITTPTVVKSEFKLNATDLGIEYYSEIVALKGGGFVSVWRDDNYDVRGRIFDNDGVAISDTDFKINTTPTNAIHAIPYIAALEDGGFVTTWSGDADYNNYAQRFDAKGNALGGQISINTEVTEGNQSRPAVTGLSNGGFVSVYQAQRDATSDYDQIGQLFDANGTAIGNSFQVSQNNADRQQNTNITTLKNGNFVATWHTTHASNRNYEIAGRMYSQTGVALGDEFAITVNSSGRQVFPDIAALEGGGFVITWTDQGSASVKARVFDATGTTTTANHIVVDSASSSYNAKPSVTGIADGGFVVAWDGLTNSLGIQAQRFDAKGSTVGSHITNVSTTTGYQYQPNIVALSNGKIGLNWSSSNGTSNYEIYGAIYDVGVAPASVTETEIARNTITRLDTVLKTLNAQRAKLGAISNRLDHTVHNLTNISANLSAARSSIKDADFATETVEMTKNQILQQASTAMLAQANASKQNMLSLLQV